MKTKFVKETDRKGTYIIEGSFDGTFFNIKRFICQVQKQETEKETQELADFIPRALIQIREAIHRDTIVYVSKDHITNVLNTVEYDKPFQILGVNFLVTSSSKYKTIIL